MKELKPTLRCPEVIVAVKDAERLHKTMRSTGSSGAIRFRILVVPNSDPKPYLIGADEEVVNEILGHRSLEQRLMIKDAYYKLYGNDLVEKLSASTTGDYDSLIKTLFRKPIEILAYDLFKGIKGLGTNYTVLDEIICCCDNAEIYHLKKAYYKLIEAENPKEARQRSLEIDVGKETKGSYWLLLGQLLKGNRFEEPIQNIQAAIEKKDFSRLANPLLVEEDVKDLYNAGQGLEGKGDASVFISILTRRSRFHIAAIWRKYNEKYGCTLVDAISKKFANPFRNGINTMIMSLVNLKLLLVSQLYCSMEGLGTNEDTLIRIVCLRNEIDLEEIKEIYGKVFFKPLSKAVSSDTSGSFKKLLLILLDEAPRS